MATCNSMICPFCGCTIPDHAWIFAMNNWDNRSVIDEMIEIGEIPTDAPQAEITHAMIHLPENF